MRSTKKGLGFIVVLVLVVGVVGWGSSILLKTELSADWSNSNIQEASVPLSDGDEVHDPVFVSIGGDPADSDNDSDSGSDGGAAASDSSGSSDTNVDPDGQAQQEELELTGRKKRDQAADEITLSDEASEPHELTDVTESEEEVDQQFAEDEATDEPQAGIVRVTVNPDGPVEMGQTVKLSAHVKGFKKGTYALQWQVKEADEWQVIQGATSRSLKLVINKENINYQWRVVVIA